MDEPTVIGSTVLDAEGELWVRVYPAGGPAPWHRTSFAPGQESWAVWSAISVDATGVPDHPEWPHVGDHLWGQWYPLSRSQVHRTCVHPDCNESQVKTVD